MLVAPSGAARKELGSKIKRPDEIPRHNFYLLNRGNAINFVHGAVVGDFILLVQKEMIDTIIYIDNHKLENRVQDGFDSVRERVADLWLNYFLKVKV